MKTHTKLYKEDQEKVDAYLNRPNHRLARKPFRPWLLMGVIVVVMLVMSGLSYYLAFEHGVV